MKNSIQELYKLAEVEKEPQYIPSTGEIIGYGNYPNFTAEKQINLIKKLGNINIDINNGCYIHSDILKVEAKETTFEEALADFVINLWKDLTQQEKQEIKRILE